MTLARAATSAALALGLSALSFSVHIVAPSTWHLEPDYWARAVHEHATKDQFKVRPLTTRLVSFLHERLSMSYKHGWFALQFTLMIMACTAFYAYLSALGFTHSLALLGQLGFGLSPPVFMAHFEPMHTWSDFWVYVLLPMALMWAVRRRYAPGAVALGLALAAREVTLLFMPVWAAVIGLRERKWLPALGWCGVSLILFAGIRLALSGDVFAPASESWHFNFDGVLRTRDTLFSLWLSCGAFWVIGLWQAWQSEGPNLQPRSVWTWGTLWITLGYVASTLLFARARETRLFFPAGILLIPLTLAWIDQRRSLIMSRVVRHGRWRVGAAGLALVALCVLAVTLVFPAFEYRRWGDGNRLFAGLQLALLLGLWVLGRPAHHSPLRSVGDA